MALGLSRPDDADAEINDRSQCQQPEPAPAGTQCEVLLDHHVEELLAALDELVRRYGWCLAKRQNTAAGYTQLRSDVRASLLNRLLSFDPSDSAAFRAERGATYCRAGFLVVAETGHATAATIRRLACCARPDDCIGQRLR